MYTISKSIQTGQNSRNTPSVVEFKGKLYCAFTAPDDANRLYCACYNDEKEWSLIGSIGAFQTMVSPSLCVYGDKIYCAFTNRKILYCACSKDGKEWSLTGSIGAFKTEVSPSLCVFNEVLYCAFAADDDANRLYYACYNDGKEWSLTGSIGAFKTEVSPSLCVFNEVLYCAFAADDDANRLYCACCKDGKEWSLTGPIGVPGPIGWLETSYSPALCVYKDILFCAFKPNRFQNLSYTSSQDGINWSDIEHIESHSTDYGPSLVVLKEDNLKCFFVNLSKSILHVRIFRADWMNQNFASLSSLCKTDTDCIIKLKDICIIGSHDAGMSIAQNGTAFGSECNTVTQTLSIFGQLRNGARYFDIRPSISNGNYYTGHYKEVKFPGFWNYINPIGWQGKDGQSIDDIVSDINKFTSTNKELIILNISNNYQTDDGFRAFLPQEFEDLITKLKEIECLYLNPDPDIDLKEMHITEFINNEKATVLIILNPPSNIVKIGDVVSFIPKNGVDITKYFGQGFFAGNSFKVYNEYSGKNVLEDMIEDQLGKMKANINIYFILSWTLTQSKTQAINCWANTAFSILDLATIANANLYENPELMRYINDGIYPQVLFVDDVNSEVGLVEMAMIINEKALEKVVNTP
jgi:hypothetical protein